MNKQKSSIKIKTVMDPKSFQNKLNVTFMLGYKTRNGSWQHMASSDSISKLLRSKWLEGKKDNRTWIIKKKVKSEQIESICELLVN